MLIFPALKVSENYRCTMDYVMVQAYFFVWLLITHDALHWANLVITQNILYTIRVADFTQNEPGY